MPEGDNGFGWHLDKRVPIALIAALVMQTVGTVWWASGLNTRVAQLEQQYLQIAPQGGQIIRLQTQLEAIASNISDIKSALMRAETLRTNGPRP